MSKNDFKKFHLISYVATSYHRAFYSWLTAKSLQLSRIVSDVTLRTYTELYTGPYTVLDYTRHCLHS